MYLEIVRNCPWPRWLKIDKLYFYKYSSMKKRDHEHTGFSWYLTEKRNVFNPYNLSDRISRKTWYENITYHDLTKNKVKVKKVSKFEYPVPHVHNGPNGLFTSLSCPECH